VIEITIADGFSFIEIVILILRRLKE
jgi:5-methylcytosine-specific restriction protein A